MGQITEDENVPQKVHGNNSTGRVESVLYKAKLLHVTL